jgi:peptide/nickel transport system substrate-binding protein
VKFIRHNSSKAGHLGSITAVRRLGVLAVLSAAALLAAACAGTTPGKSANGGVFTFAEPAGAPPNYIFPLAPSSEYGTDINQFQNLMWPPLYQFGENGAPVLNESLSLAYPPVYTNGDRTVTIRLKKYDWSDGHPVTSRDVEFWLNLLKANKLNYLEYIPGDFPDNVASMSFPNPTTVVLNLTKSFNPVYYTDNNLDLLYAIPQHVWDKTSSSSPVGNYDMTPSGATAVYNYLNSQSKDLSTYASNPLWKVVDGPWKMQSYNVTGDVVFVPNRLYSGPDKPKLAAFEEEPFISSTAEVNVLRSGGLDYGYIPINDLSLTGYFQSHGYKVASWPLWGVVGLTLNYQSLKTGPMVQQLYIRQAMQHLINQPQWIKQIWDGYSAPTYGPIPTKPANSFVTSAETSNPYPYDPTEAISLLKSHGWTVRPGGVSSCSHPGSGPNECGAGISAGAQLSLSFWVLTGIPQDQTEAEAMKSAFSQAGIQINLSFMTASALGPQLHPCGPTGPCHPAWGMVGFFSGTAAYYPSGEEYLATGAPDNFGQYNSKTMDQLIDETFSSQSAFQEWEAYAAQQLPGLNVPTNGPYQISVVKSDLTGELPQESTTNIFPQQWYYPK